MPEELFTPKELANKKILSLVQQWKERKVGRLGCYRIGRKILYSERHLQDYLAICERSNDEQNQQEISAESEGNEEVPENV